HNRPAWWWCSRRLAGLAFGMVFSLLRTSLTHWGASTEGSVRILELYGLAFKPRIGEADVNAARASIPAWKRPRARRGRRRRHHAGPESQNRRHRYKGQEADPHRASVTEFDHDRLLATVRGRSSSKQSSGP